MFPRSATGRSSLVPPPPWHYSGQMLTIEYRTDPAAVAELLPPPLEPAADDPGAVAVIWADWQSCSDTFEELLDPVRSQYVETFVVVRCAYQRRDVQPVRVHLGRQGLRHGARPPPGLPEEARRAVRHPPGERRRRRAAARARRALRGDVLGLRPAADRRHVHDHRHGADGRVRQRPPDDPPPRVPGHRERRHRLAARARHDARLRRRGRAVLRRRRHDRAPRVAGRGADPPGAGRDDRRATGRRSARTGAAGTTLERDRRTRPMRATERQRGAAHGCVAGDA